jgi:hypothetical protein
MLRRLVALREAQLEDGRSDAEPQLVIVTPDPDRRGTRSTAWVELLARVGRRQEQPVFPARVVGWDRVAEVVSVSHVPRHVSGSPVESFSLDGMREATPPWRAPVWEQLLHLIGRHPFLTVDQLAGLFGTTQVRIKGIERELVEKGWLRRIDLEELPGGAMGLGRNEWQALGLVEVTGAGRARLASWLGLDVSAATRYHGIIGNSRGQAGRRRRLLRTLAHTLGVNGVFVARWTTKRNCASGRSPHAISAAPMDSRCAASAHPCAMMVPPRIPRMSAASRAYTAGGNGGSLG